MNGPGVADLIIMGSIPSLGIGFGPLWVLDLEDVSLYGVSNSKGYVLEGAGTIMDSLITRHFPEEQLVGKPGVMRGNLDFIDAPAGWMPSLYDPSDDVNLRIETAYSGETGWGEPIPEPATMIALGFGIAALAARRRRKRAA